MKKKNLNRSIMFHEAWLEDGRTIGRLDRERRWLARQLALQGKLPGEVSGAGADADEIELAQIEDAWLEAAGEAGAGQGGGSGRFGHRVAGRAAR